MTGKRQPLQSQFEAVELQLAGPGLKQHPPNADAAAFGMERGAAVRGVGQVDCKGKIEARGIFPFHLVQLPGQPVDPGVGLDGHAFAPPSTGRRAQQARESRGNWARDKRARGAQGHLEGLKVGLDLQDPARVPARQDPFDLDPHRLGVLGLPVVPLRVQHDQPALPPQRTETGRPALARQQAEIEIERGEGRQGVPIRAPPVQPQVVDPNAGKAVEAHAPRLGLPGRRDRAPQQGPDQAGGHADPRGPAQGPGRQQQRHQQPAATKGPCAAQQPETGPFRRFLSRALDVVIRAKSSRDMPRASARQAAV